MDTATTETLATIDRFNDAFNRHDVDGVMALMTDDVIFENTSPPPDGERLEGQAAVRTFWETFFAGSPRATVAPSAGATPGATAPSAVSTFSACGMARSPRSFLM
jgi:ketosteroid isomerase-like protein